MCVICASPSRFSYTMPLSSFPHLLPYLFPAPPSSGNTTCSDRSRQGSGALRPGAGEDPTSPGQDPAISGQGLEQNPDEARETRPGPGSRRRCNARFLALIPFTAADERIRRRRRPAAKPAARGGRKGPKPAPHLGLWTQNHRPVSPIGHSVSESHRIVSPNRDSHTEGG